MGHEVVLLVLRSSKPESKEIPDREGMGGEFLAGLAAAGHTVVSVQVELRPFNDAQLNRDLHALCTRLATHSQGFLMDDGWSSLLGLLLNVSVQICSTSNWSNTLLI